MNCFSVRYRRCFYHRLWQMKILSWHRSFSSTTGKKFTETLNLPRSRFPMKHNRRLELDIENQNIRFEDLFRANDSAVGTFILHDGPPYANGDPHFGHAINRILKDIIVKRKILENYRVDYRPGWDCHGLPIELKALPPDVDFRTIPAQEIRVRARRLATETIERQRNAFQQWFISADWSSTYRTFDIEYCCQELRAFYQMYRNGLIFRDRMPVYWSPSSRTALAEAELQYRDDHVSRAAYIRYPVANNDFDALIWTTTPWTLLANDAIAYSEKLHYCLVQSDDSQRPLLVARENLPLLREKLKREFPIVTDAVDHCYIAKYQYRDPIDDQMKPFLSSIHVTATKGTGLIHTAGDHGHEDYKLIKQHLKNHCRRIQSIVDDEGRLILPGDNHRISITDENNEASRYVLEKILPPGSVLAAEDYCHSYPYDWRTGRPVLIRPSDQWFLNMDSIRDRCVKALDKVKIYPEILRKEMINQLMTRPNWCLSRQRKYGVPIPVFYERTTGKPILTDEIFENILNRFRLDGLDVWWQQEPPQLLSDCQSLEENLENLVKGEDILDIWFDSGCSWLAVLPEPEQCADLYLEGVDQIRGWFQSSLITSVSLRDQSPYRAIFIHGFALDRDGHKMSKSLGNVIDPMGIINGDCGVDGLRFWIARNACHHNDVHVDPKEFQQDILTIVNRFRNTFRFILGYLEKYQDFKPIQINRLLDQYLMYRIAEFNRIGNRCYREYCLGDLMESMIHHLSYEISTFYLTRIKDRLYCDRSDSPEVLAIITVLYHCYHTVLYHLAPVMPHLAMECHREIMSRSDGIIPETSYQKISEDFLTNVRFVQKIIDSLNRWAGSKYRLLDYDCHISVDEPNALRALQMFQPNAEPDYRSELTEWLLVAQTSYDDGDLRSPRDGEIIIIPSSSTSQKIENEPIDNIRIMVKPTTMKRCQRCRRPAIISPPVGLCDRCIQVLGDL